MEERAFKGIWIPKEIWLDERLTALDKVILAEIDSLDNDGCTASNDYLAKMCGCTSTKVSKAITKLKNFGMIEIVSFDGRQRKMKSCLEFFSRQTLTKEQGRLEQKNKADLNKKQVSPYNKKIVKKIDESIGDKPKRFIQPTLEEVTAYCEERKNGIDAQHFVDYYSANGWKVGKNPMKDWKAAVRYWERNGISKPKEQPKDTSYDLDEFEKLAGTLF
jgi:biotin operon repressor